MTKWYYRHESVEAGPLDLEAVREAVAGGRLAGSDFIKRDEGSWMPAGACPELSGAFGAPSPPPPPPIPNRNGGADAKPIWPWLVGVGAIAFIVLMIFLMIAGLAGSQLVEPATVTTTTPADVAPQTFTTAAPIGAIIDISGVDATPELGRIVAQMNNEQKLAIGFYNAATGLDFYAARVRVSNSGDQAYFITPKNIRLHLYGESVGVVPMKDPRFLQPTMLMPDHYIEGMVVYLATPHAGAAMRLGEGSISYEFAD
jgi:hypothetical protein